MAVSVRIYSNNNKYKYERARISCQDFYLLALCIQRKLLFVVPIFFINDFFGVTFFNIFFDFLKLLILEGLNGWNFGCNSIFFFVILLKFFFVMDLKRLLSMWLEFYRHKAKNSHRFPNANRFIRKYSSQVINWSYVVVEWHKTCSMVSYTIFCSCIDRIIRSFFNVV